MGIPGYAGNILYVDLSTGQARKEPLDPELVHKFLGGWGINQWLAYNLIPPQVDPYAPENAIILGTGPFNGTLIPGAAELLITTKYPINGAFATAAGGGHFAMMLKSNGCDHVVITGKAPMPVFLKFTGHGAEICDARPLWGKPIFDSVDELRRLYEPCSVIPIGQAGENLVRYSLTSIDKGGTVGRGGLASIMGSKNLKALVALMGDHPIEMANRSRLHEMVDGLIDRMMAWPGRGPLIEGGIGGQLSDWWGAEPQMIDNRTRARFPTQKEIQENKEFWRLYKQCRKTLACASCPLGDKEVVKIKEGPYQGLVSYGNSVAAPPGASKLSGMDRLGLGMDWENTLNQYGIDFITFNAVFSLMVYLYEKGIITKEDTGGLELRDDQATAKEVARRVAYREGFGDILAEGIVGAVERLGKGQEYAWHIKGQGLVFDPRVKGFGTMEMTQITNPRGAHVAAGGSPSYLPGRSIGDFYRHAERMGASPEAIQRAVGPSDFNPGRWTKFSEDWFSLFNTLGHCNRAMVNRFYLVGTLADLLGALTGLELSPAELMKVAERNYNLWRVLNARAGFSRKDDQPPEVWFQPLIGEEGQEYLPTNYFKNRALSRGDIEQFLDDYYEERGWDKKTGLPTPEKLKELGLEVKL